jgi:Phage tail protein
MAFPSPSLVPPTLEDFQWQFNGLTIGANTPFGVLKVEGFDLPEVRHGDVDIPRDHGRTKGLDVYAGKAIIFDLWMKTDGISLQDAQLKLATATLAQPNEESPLWFQLPNLPLMCVMCRPRKRPMTIDSNYAAANIGEPELVLEATDPRLYQAGQAETLTLSTPSGGLAFPVTFPVTFSSTTPSTIVVVNGNMEMRPIVIFNGPLTNPAIENGSITGSPFLMVVNPEETEFTVQEGDQILLNLGSPHLLQYFQGGVTSGNEPNDIMNWLTSESTWWDLLPSSNTIRFYSQDATNTGGTATLQWAPANII